MSGRQDALSMPTIQSVGPPPEVHSRRLAGEFTHWLVAEHQRREPAWAAAIEARSDGNPRGQKKLLERLRAAAGPVFLDAVLTPGKRRKYSLLVSRWLGWNRSGPIIAGSPIPERPWLAIVLERRICTHARADVEHVILALISVHAVARLCERCAARDPLDVVDAMRAMSVAIIRARGSEPPLIDPDAEPLAGWRVPYDGGIAVVRLDAESGHPFVATVLPPDDEAAS